jgi:hypothetical protein
MVDHLEGARQVATNRSDLTPGLEMSQRSRHNVARRIRRRPPGLIGILLPI